MSGTAIALASLMLAIVSAIAAIAWSIRGTLDSILGRLVALERAVDTRNGISLGELADRGEGRRIEETVKPSDRTPSEGRYVEALHEGGRDR